MFEEHSFLDMQHPIKYVQTFGGPHTFSIIVTRKKILPAAHLELGYCVLITKLLNGRVKVGWKHVLPVDDAMFD